MRIKVFYTSVTGSMEIRKTQQKIFDVLSSKNIEYEAVDISQDSKQRDLMRELAGNNTALPPQICNGDDYCGDFRAYENAIEEGDLEKFLKLWKPTTGQYMLK